MERIHSHRLERLLGAEKIAHIQQAMRGWYYKPICLLDVPGSVWVTADGDFVGRMRHGYFMSAVDAAHELWRRMGNPQFGFAGAGFSSISDVLNRSSLGYSQYQNVQKAGPAGVVGGSTTLWRVGNAPSGGSAGAAAPGGTAHTRTDAGALAFNNPAAGTLHLTGADFTASVANQSLLLYDRLFSVAKTASSTGTEAVTGVPTRYQSTTVTNPDFIGGNFGFVEVGAAALGATNHNWTVCTYTDQANAASTLPSLTGNNAGIADRLDHPVQQWFAPLEAGDVGIKAWTQMQNSASVTGACNFVIGHPIGFMLFPIINTLFPFDWITNRDLAPRIFDNACLALMQVVAASASATNYTGRFVATNAAA